jgi:ArsR family transcriptional regulator
MDKKLREEIAQIHAQFCSALADTNRILLLYAVADHPHNVSELAHLVALPQPTVSRHLKVLRERGLVTSVRDGQSVIYTLADPRIIQALDILRAVMTDQLETQFTLARNASHLLQE